MNAPVMQDQVKEARVGFGYPARGQPSKIQRLWRNHRTLQLGVYLGLLATWELAAISQGPFFLPRIGEVARAFPELLSEGHHIALLTSLQQLLIGFLIAVAIAVPLGALIGVSRTIDALVGPYINALYVASKESLLPLVIIIFGTELGYRVAVVVMFALFFPVINTAAGVRYVENHLTETARAFCTSRWRMFTRIYIPAAAPFVIAGTRLGLGMAVKGMVVAEMWVALGTGRLLRQFGAIRALDLYFAVALSIIGVALTADLALKALEKRMLHGSSLAVGKRQ